MIKVREIFASLQGEGPLSGMPAIFVRLAGCNLGCDFCDTDHDSEIKEMTEAEIINKVQEIAVGRHVGISLVVITGGEPMMQHIGDLCNMLVEKFERVQIETNGTIFLPDLPYNDLILVCSPKPYSSVHPLLVPKIDAWKILVKHGWVFSGRYASGTHDPTMVYIQPLDEKDEEKNKINIKYAIWYCMEHGFNLSLQLHKILGVR